MKLSILIGLIAIFLSSCCHTEIQYSGLVINESQNEYSYQEQSITEKEAEKHLAEMSSHEVVVSVEKNQVLVITKEEFIEANESFLKSIFSGQPRKERVHVD